MKKLIHILPVAFALSVTSAYAAGPVKTNFIDTKGEKIGTATFTDMGNGTLVSIDVNLPAGVHAMHIHEKDSCETPDFKSAGGHYNPGSEQDKKHKHSFLSGEFPDLYVESTGHIKTDIFTNRLHLKGKDGLLTHGTAIVIHENGDGHSENTTGAGSRIACAVIK